MFRTFTWLLHWIILQHTCVCSQQHLIDQASVVLCCNTCVCVLTAAIGLPKSLKESKLQLTCSAPDMCIFRNAHVYAHKQQLAGQPLTLGCNPQWTASETHMCVCSHSSNWSAEVVGCSEPSLGSLIELFCKTDVCVFTAAIGRLTLS